MGKANLQAVYNLYSQARELKVTAAGTLCQRFTMVQNNQESGRTYWANRSSVCSFVRTAHSLDSSALLTLFAELHSFTRSLARRARWKVNENETALNHSSVG